MGNPGTVFLWFIGGAVLGLLTLDGGTLPFALSVILLIWLLLTRRRMPAQIGAYLFGFGVLGTAIIIHAVVTCTPPSCHYDVSTWWYLVAAGAIALMGACLIALAALRGRRAQG